MAVVLFIVLSVIALKATIGMYGKYRESAARRSVSERQLAELQARAEVLSTDIERLKTPGGVEREIRQQFSVVREGEEMAIVLDSAREPATEPSQKTGFFRSIMRWFGVK